jgi:hypothetical protein
MKVIVTSLTTILLISLWSCSSTPPDQRLNPAVYYKNDICFTYSRNISKHGEAKTWYRNRVKRRFSKRNKTQEIKFCGVGVLPHDDKYELKINHVAKLNYFAMNTCHREVTTENPDRGIFKKDGQYYVDYKPTLELGRACPLYVAAYNRTGKHGWGIIAFENPRFTLPATVHCNGDVIEFNGTSICEGRQGLLQKVTFPEEVVWGKPVKGAADRKSPCPEINAKTPDNKTFEFIMPPRECVYPIVSKESKKIHKMYTVGYEELVVRGN